jgi:glycosyltransferase involved in cell wall biosynthesis
MNVEGERPPLRVLVVARWYPAVDDPGAGVFVADHCAALTAAGVEVRVASFENAPLFAGDASTERRLAVRWADAAAAGPPFAGPVSWGAAGVPVARLRAVTRPRVGDGLDEVRRIAPEAVPLRAFGRALAASWPFDLVHAHTGIPDGAAAAALANDLGVPIVTTEHDHAAVARLADPSARQAYARLVGSDRTLVAVSVSLGGALAGALGLPPEDIAVVPNPVDIDAFALGDPAARDPDELLFVGRLRASKGIAELLEAVALARRTRPNLRLRLIGDATDTDAGTWERTAAALGIRDAVAFEAPRGRAAIVAAMQRAAAFVHPSRLETFGIVAAEALATGLPVVATPSGGVDEILGRDGRLGEVAAGFAPVDIAAAIELLLERRTSFDPADLRAVVAERYAPSTVAARTIELYERSLAGRARHSAPSTGGSPGTPLRPLPVVLAFRHNGIEPRLGPLPSALREHLTVVTVAETEPADGAGRAPRSGAGRLLWILRHPIAALRRRLTARRRPAERLRRRRAAVRDALAGTSGPLTLLPLDADDLLAAEPFLDDRVTLAAGGVRWLADAWDQDRADDRPADLLRDA